MTEALVYGFLERIEANTEDKSALGALRIEITSAPGLEDGERESLIGRIEVYLADIARAEDPWERYERGEGPLPDEMPVAPYPVEDDDRPYDEDELPPS